MLPPNNLHAKKLVIYNSTVDTHKGHEIEHGAKVKGNTNPQQHESMSPIAEHHTEEEGYSDEHEHGWDDLVVLGDGEELGEDVAFVEAGKAGHDCPGFAQRHGD